MNRANIIAVALVVLASSTLPFPTFAAQAPDSGVWAVRTVDRPTGDPVSGVLVSFPEHDASSVTDSRGLATGAGSSDRVFREPLPQA